MPGSNINLADCNTVLNTAVAKSLKEFADEMQGVADADFEAAALAYIKKTLVDHQRIIFNGNGYSQEWEEEAARRGLANNRNTADATKCMIDQKTFDLFEEFGVMSEAEIRSRYEVKLETYTKILNIEARVMERMGTRTYLPAITRYAGDVSSAIINMKTVGVDTSTQEALAAQLAAGLTKASAALDALKQAHAAALACEEGMEMAQAYAAEVVPAMEALRESIDSLEVITSRDYWPVPSYNNILFYV